MATNEISAKLTLKTEDYKRRLEEAERKMQQFGNTVKGQKKVIDEFGDSAGEIGLAFSAMAAIAVAAGTQMTQSFAEADKALASLAATAGLSKFSDQIQQVARDAEEFGVKFGQSKATVVTAIEEVYKAGVSLDKLRGDQLEGVLSLIAAGELEAGDAAKYLSSALNGYKSEQLDAIRVANIAVGSANASATSVKEMIYANAALGPTLALVGAKFEDVNTVMALFANNALIGSDAGKRLPLMSATA